MSLQQALFMGAGAPQVRVDAAQFDGVNDYLQRASAWAGARLDGTDASIARNLVASGGGRLTEASIGTLDAVVEDCVNAVGADVNTASAPLLSRISGLTESIAQNIVSFRDANGAFLDRQQLLQVPRVGARTFQQCAGFLRVMNGRNPTQTNGGLDRVATSAGAVQDWGIVLFFETWLAPVLKQIVRQISRKLTWKVQEDFHASHGLECPPRKRAQF